MRFGRRTSRLVTGSMMIRHCRRYRVGFGPIIDLADRVVGSSEQVDPTSYHLAFPLDLDRRASLCNIAA